MIICISANPAIDRRLHVDQLRVGEVNRAQQVQPRPGGKAANVALALRALGASVQWIGFLGGAMGEQCEQGLAALGVPVIPVHTRSATRTNLEILGTDGKVTEILEPGGGIEDDEVQQMLSCCHDLFAKHKKDCSVVISGSIPPGAPTDLYAQMIHLAREFGHKVYLDASGEPMVRALAAAPDFIKLNRHEVGWAMGRQIVEPGDAVEAARWLIAQGARSAAVSLGAEGIVWIGSATVEPIIAQPPAVPCRSTVGCGDATLAGFVQAATHGMDSEETIRLATACGTANCFAEAAGRINIKDVQRIKPLIYLSSKESSSRQSV